MSETAHLIATHIPLLDRIVRETMNRVPSCVDRNDLATAGLIALTMAADAFDPEHGVPFDQYAAARVRRAIADELRGTDWGAVPPADVEQVERLAYLGGAIAELPELLRLVCEQYFLAERPTAAIAEALGITEAQVSQLRTEGLHVLRDALTPGVQPARRTPGAHRSALAPVCA